MSASDVQNEILEPMQRLFLPPRNMDEGAITGALREYIGALQSFEAADLRAAWSRVRDTHATRAWPVPAAFVLAARTGRNERLPDTKTASPFKRPQPSELWDKWLKARSGPKAQEAARRNLAWSFKCAVLDGLELDAIDIRDLAIKKASAERTAHMIETGQEIPWKGRKLRFSRDNADVALRMWRNLLVQETETQQEILNALAA